jgi:putative tricarboxylic transport membrane protein
VRIPPSTWRPVTADPYRMTGAGLLVVAALAAWLSRDFRVFFLVDPVGPRGLPLVAASLLLAGAVGMLLRPGTRGREGPGDGIEGGQAPPAMDGARQGAVAMLFLYPALLPLLGFPLATGLALWMLARPLGGRGWRGAAVSFGMAGILFVVFVHLLGVRLPVGWLLFRGGG